MLLVDAYFMPAKLHLANFNWDYVQIVIYCTQLSSMKHKALLKNKDHDKDKEKDKDYLLARRNLSYT